MKFVAILSLAVLLPFGSAQCPKFACDPSSAKWATTSTCGTLDTEKQTQYDIRSCTTAGEMCSVAPGANADTLCATPAAPPAQTMYPGESCSGTQYPCKTGTCTGGSCPATLKAGDACVNVYDCGGSLTCISEKCTALAAVGASCLQHTDCVQTAGCSGADLTVNPQVPGKCVSYMSVSSGSAAPNCVATSTALAQNNFCSSGYCYQQSATSYLCADLLKSEKSPPQSCPSAGSTCSSTTDPNSKTALTNPCECAYDGNYYCNQFPGDSDYVSYTSLVKDFQSSSVISTCNTYRNLGAPITFMNPCNLAVNTLTDKQVAGSTRLSSYAWYAKADSCVLKIVNPDYYKVDNKASIGFVLSGLLLALMN